MSALVDKITRALKRDQGLSPAALAKKIVSNVEALALAKATLRACSRVGARARTFGVPRVDNKGVMSVGDDFAVSCRFGDALLATGDHGRLEIGDSVTVNYGTAISASERVHIGDRVMIGPYCVVSDTDLPSPLAHAGDTSSPIEIGEDAWLAARVVVRPGVHIGAHAVVAAGSVVETDIPPYAIASGSPAKVLRVRSPDEEHPHATHAA